MKNALMHQIFMLMMLWAGLHMVHAQAPGQRPSYAGDLVLAPYSTTIFSDGSDRADIMITIMDANGNNIPSVTAPLSISVQGGGRIVAQSNLLSPSNSVVLTPEGRWTTQMVDGVSRFSLVSDSVGAIKMEVTCAGYRPVTSEIHAIHPFPQMVPTAEQLKPSSKFIPKMIGADISNLPQTEARGMKFSDNGVEKDAIAILKDHGFNAIRLRLFNDPAAPGGYSRQGFCDLENTKKMARRIKDAGLYFLLDFHYSDYWADPQQQNKPSAWKELSGDALTKAVKEYTSMVIKELKDQGTPPDMVQNGNEINHGMLWPDGHIGNPDRLASMIKAGIDGVLEVDSSIIIMVHVALGGQYSESVRFFDNMIARGVEFDIIGLSYYPRWHCTLDDLKDNMVRLIERYNKDVNLVEYSLKKQEVHDIVFNLPNDRGRGSFIWEPLNTWERVFDGQGKSNDLLRLYDGIAAKYLSE